MMLNNTKPQNSFYSNFEIKWSMIGDILPLGPGDTDTQHFTVYDPKSVLTNICFYEFSILLECGNLLLLFYSSMFTEYRGNYCKEDNYPFLAFKIGNQIFLKIYVHLFRTLF